MTAPNAASGKGGGQSLIQAEAEKDARGGTSVRGFEPITDEDLESVRKCAFIRGMRRGIELSAEVACEVTEEHQALVHQCIPCKIRVRIEDLLAAEAHARGSHADQA